MKAACTRKKQGGAYALLPFAFCLLTFLSAISCQPPAPPPAPEAPKAAPLPVQQAAAYPETVTGRFVSLADFEDSRARTGRAQLDNFLIEPSGGGQTKFVVNITRTGAGAMEVTLGPKSQLIFNIHDFHDFTGYNLISFALYSESLRDDLCVEVPGGQGRWCSKPTLVKPGWNTVLIDIARLAGQHNFDIRNVRAMRLYFADAAGPVIFNIDDIMLVNNSRAITPVPPGLSLRKDGLDYTLSFADGPALVARTGRLSDPDDTRDARRTGREAVHLRQDDQGLWQLDSQPAIQLLAKGEDWPAEGGARLAPMGERSVGMLDVLENNELRIRMESVWYFPSRRGEWLSLAVRQIRWQYTWYADGRFICCAELNNTGQGDIDRARMVCANPVGWAGGLTGGTPVPRKAKDTSATINNVGTTARWCFIDGGDIDSYVNPGTLAIAVGQAAYAPGDKDRDGFDESQGCYFLEARAGQCRFTLTPPPAGVVNPVFRVQGRWSGEVHVNSQGLPLRPVVKLPDGGIIFSLQGKITQPAIIEVAGTPSY